MKQLVFIFTIICLAVPAMSQKIVNIVLVGKNGVTKDKKEATSFIVMKKLEDGSFQRLNYNMRRPLQSVQTYSDASLSVLEGPYYSYNEAGLLQLKGEYHNNKKDKEWHYYNDTFKVIKTEVFEEGVLVKTIDPDTVKKVIDTVKNDSLPKLEIEASFPGGDKAWVKYLTKNIDPDAGAKSVKGGKVLVCFVVTVTGKVARSFLRKSVEFVLDEEALHVINNSPDWKPAVQNGKKVNAYRVQPLTFEVI